VQCRGAVLKKHRYFWHSSPLRVAETCDKSLLSRFFSKESLGFGKFGVLPAIIPTKAHRLNILRKV